MRNIFTLLVLLGLLISVGCQPSALEIVSTEVSPTLQPENAQQEILTPDRIEPNMTKVPERIPTTEVAPPITGEVPKELLESIINDLSQRVGVDKEKITVIRGEEIVWNDGSLGCPKPGELYTQSLVNGYWVILEANGTTYDYRAADTGYFFMCENKIPPAPPATPNS